MTVTKWLPGLLAVAGIITWSGAGMADRGGKGDDNANVLHADMRGYDETPSVSSTGSGEWRAMSGESAFIARRVTGVEVVRNDYNMRESTSEPSTRQPIVTTDSSTPSFTLHASKTNSTRWSPAGNPMAISV